MHIVHFLGVPGAGKSTIINRLCQEHPLCRNLYIGQIIRDEIQRQTPLGREMQLMLSQANVLSADAIVSLFRREINQHEAMGVSILFVDGFPRSADQACAYLQHFGHPSLAICLTAPVETITERLIARQQSSAARLDDTEDIIHQRIAKSWEHVQPGLDVYMNNGCKVEIVDGSGCPDIVYTTVLKTLNKHRII